MINRLFCFTAEALPYIHDYAAEMRKEYKKRGTAMIEALEASLPPYVTFEKPRGGFYTWLRLPEGSDATAVLRKAIGKGTVFVTGKTFDPDGVKNDFMRVSFCNTHTGAIHRGIPLVAEAIYDVCGR